MTQFDKIAVDARLSRQVRLLAVEVVAAAGMDELPEPDTLHFLPPAERKKMLRFLINKHRTANRLESGCGKYD